MKISDIPHMFKTIFTNQDLLLTIAFFGIGLILAATATYVSLEERVRKDALGAEETERIEADLPRLNGTLPLTRWAPK